MNITNLELCKELYELSGWEQMEKSWVKNKDTAGVIHISHPEYQEVIKDFVCPAYSAGYLLRKLPKGFSLTFDELTKSVSSVTHPNSYICTYTKDKQFFQGIANTPEDCATKLAIKLFKRGILKK